MHSLDRRITPLTPYFIPVQYFHRRNTLAFVSSVISNLAVTNYLIWLIFLILISLILIKYDGRIIDLKMKWRSAFNYDTVTDAIFIRISRSQQARILIASF